MNNDVSLNNLNIMINDSDNVGVFLLEIFELILKNSKFISDIENFTLLLLCYLTYPKLQHFLTSLPSLFSSIKHLNTSGINFENELFTDLIRSQTQLSSLTLYSITSNVLDAFKYCSSTLTSIMFENCEFTYISSFDEFKFLTQLRFLGFSYCYGITTQNYQSLPVLKIKPLRIIGDNSGIDLLFQKVGSFLESLELRLWKGTIGKRVIESIINCCDKIQFLYLYDIYYENLPQLFKLITHLNKHLKYLSFQYKYHWSYDDGNGLKISSKILKGLGQILPDSLEYLDLYLTIDPNDLKIFLDNCKHVGLNKLLVKNDNNNNIDTTFNILKKFVRENNIKNFAYQVSRYFDPEDLIHCKLEKLVREAQPFVKMKSYDDLVIRFSDI